MRPIQLTLLFCVLGVLAGCGAPTQRILTPTTLPGKIIARGVVGEVKALTPGTGESVRLVNDMQLTQGMVVSTGPDSSVTLIFSNAAVVTLAPRSEVAIEAFTQIPPTITVIPETATEEPSSSVTKLTLVHGEISGKVPKLNTDRGSSFVIRSPAGDKELKGTTFQLTAP